MADENKNEFNEPEVVEAVTKEIKALGENTKANYEKLRKNHEDLKSLVTKYDEKMAADIKEQVTKISEDIVTRQDAIDKKANERMDQIELALKRPVYGSLEEKREYEKEILDFYRSAAICATKEGVTYKDLENIKTNKEEYDAYKKNFEIFLRQKGDSRSLSPEQYKSLTVGIDPDGGYTVTPAMSNRIVTKIYETDPIRQLAAHETITTQAIEWMVDWDQAGWGWEAETETGAETTTPTWNKKRIPVHVIYAKPRASQTLLEDSGINIQNWLSDKVAKRFGRGSAAAFVTGNGVGKPRGFLTYSSGTTYGTVEQVNMGAASTIVANGFIDVKYSLTEEYLNRGTWLMARSSVAATMLLMNGAGDYIWKPGFKSDDAATILSLPVRMSTTMPTIASDSLSVALADWSEAYMVVDRLGISIQRDPYTAKPMVEFYTRARVGGDVINYDAIKIGKIAA